jgi:hypothetical protein
MTNYLLVIEMGIAIVLAIVIAGLLGLFFPEIASTAGGVIATMYFFSRYPWGGREETNDQLDELFDRYLPFDSTR